jgi:hypothetical protein
MLDRLGRSTADLPANRQVFRERCVKFREPQVRVAAFRALRALSGFHWSGSQTGVQRWR